MRRILERYYQFLKLALTILMFLLIIPVSLQIFSSYMGKIPLIGPYIDIPRYIWTEEMARFCFIWIVLVGSIVAVKEGTHFTVDLFPEAKSKRSAGIRDLFVDIMILLTALVFIWWGKAFVASSLMQTSEMAGLPMVYIYIAWPIAGVSWVLFLADNVVKHAKMIWSNE